MSAATDALGVPLFTSDMMEPIRPEQKRHLPGIQDLPGIPLHTITGYIMKGGVQPSRLEMCTLFSITGKFLSALNMIYSMYINGYVFSNKEICAVG